MLLYVYILINVSSEIKSNHRPPFLTHTLAFCFPIFPSFPFPSLLLSPSLHNLSFLTPFFILSHILLFLVLPPSLPPFYTLHHSFIFSCPSAFSPPFLRLPHSLLSYYSFLSHPHIYDFSPSSFFSRLLHPLLFFYPFPVSYHLFIPSFNPSHILTFPFFPPTRLLFPTLLFLPYPTCPLPPLPLYSLSSPTSLTNALTLTSHSSYAKTQILILRALRPL